MKESLRSGIEHEFRFVVPSSKTVPALYPEAEEFGLMPAVFATGFLVGLIEWACIQAINPHIDWPAEQSVGTHVDISHSAATPPGFPVTVKAKLVEVAGRRLIFEVEAHDGVEPIAKGRHERFVIDRSRFGNKLAQKSATQPSPGS